MRSPETTLPHVARSNPGHKNTQGDQMPTKEFPSTRPPDGLTLADLWIKLQRLEWLLDGNKDYDIKGLRGEQEETQKALAALVLQRDKMTWVIRGLVVGLGITTTGTLAQVIPALVTALSSIK